MPATRYQTPGLALSGAKTSSVDTKIKAHHLRVVTRPDGGTGTVLAHDKSHIDEGVVFGEKAGPVGEGSSIRGSRTIIMGAVFRDVEIGDGATVDHGARIGSIGEKVGSIIIGPEVYLGINTRIHSPKKTQSTNIGAGSSIGRGSTVGIIETTQHGTNSKKLSKGKGIEIGEGSRFGNSTIIRPGVIVEEGANVGDKYELSEGLVLPAGIYIPNHNEYGQVELTSENLSDYTR